MEDRVCLPILCKESCKEETEGQSVGANLLMGGALEKTGWFKSFQGNYFLMGRMAFEVPSAQHLCLLRATLKSLVGPGALG